MTTLKQARAIANLPVDDPHWYSSSGEEYKYIASSKYVVLNGKAINRRIRTICKVIEEISIDERTLI